MLGGYTARQDVKLDFFKELSQKGLAANLRWFPKIAYSDIAAIYKMAGKSGGGLIVTSKDESFGMVVAEAMLCFCPVLVNKVGALPELVKHAKTGWLHDNSFRSLSNCLADIKDKEKRRKVCEQANELIKAEYSLEKVGALFKKLVQSG